MYKIKKQLNYIGQYYHVLIKDGIVLHSICKPDIDKFKTKNISFDDSEGIEKYLKNHNL